MGDKSRLILRTGAMAMDGGSIALSGARLGANVRLFLDWSLASRDHAKPQFSVDDQPIQRGSDDERLWLTLIENAEFEFPSETAPSDGPKLSPNALIIGDDIARYANAIQQGPRAALLELAQRLVEIVRSRHHQTPVTRHARRATPELPELIEQLASQGRRLEAAQAYRRARPGMPLSEALAAVDNLMRKP